PPETLVAHLAGAPAGDRDAAIGELLTHGEAGIAALIATFPGPLTVDRYDHEQESVPVEQHGPVLRAMIRFGAAAAPGLEGLCDHVSPDVRYYAVLCFAAIRHPDSLPVLGARLVDKDTTVREVAARVIDSYRDDAGFDVVVRRARSMLEKGRLSEKRLAAEALGLLHAADAAPDLIAGLNAPEPPVAEAAHRALIEIARQDFGTNVWRWRTWFERNLTRPRVEWLLDGLLSDKRPIRVGAFRELRRLTHLNYGYTPDAPPPARRAATEKWMAWWHQSGRAKFGHYR
ncbi:MAG: HEAT repeat domain-containing protein, partial [Myxococcales bacterium]|nr:HEAT repeat domain-containing protein [Myxococcales bacterium]